MYRRSRFTNGFLAVRTTLVALATACSQSVEVLTCETKWPSETDADLQALFESGGGPLGLADASENVTVNISSPDKWDSLMKPWLDGSEVNVAVRIEVYDAEGIPIPLSAGTDSGDQSEFLVAGVEADGRTLFMFRSPRRMPTNRSSEKVLYGPDLGQAESCTIEELHVAVVDELGVSTVVEDLLATQ